MFYKTFEAYPNVRSSIQYMIVAIIVKVLQFIALGSFIQNVFYPYSTMDKVTGICSFQINNDIVAVNSITKTLTIFEHIITFVFIQFCVCIEIAMETREKRLTSMMLKKLNEDFPERKRICYISDRLSIIFSFPL